MQNILTLYLYFNVPFVSSGGFEHHFVDFFFSVRGLSTIKEGKAGNCRSEPPRQ